MPDMELLIQMYVICEPYQMQIPLVLCKNCGYHRYVTCDRHVLCVCPREEWKISKHKKDK